jgi:hypothetical protein
LDLTKQSELRFGVLGFSAGRRRRGAKVEIHKKKPGQMTGLLTFEKGEELFTRLRVA